MNKDNILDIFKELNYNTEDNKDGKNYRFYHPLRVLRTATKLARLEKLNNKIDPDCLYVMALFHDIGRNQKLIEKYNLDPKKHHENNVVIFKEKICNLFDDNTKKQKLIEIVTDFSEKNYKIIESQIVRDADNLDEVGILNLWRMAVYAGKHEQDIKEIMDFYESFDRNDKYQKMNRELFLKSSKIIATEKLKEMDHLMGLLKKESLVE